MKIQPDDVLEELENALYIYFKLVMKKSLKIDKDLSLSHSELEILTIISETKDCSITDISKKSDITLAGASLFVSKLEKKGTVKKVTSPQKKSQVKVTLTRRGKKACKMHDEYHARHNGVILEYLRSLDSEDLGKSHEFSASISRWMQSFYDEATRAR